MFMNIILVLKHFEIIFFLFILGGSGQRGNIQRVQTYDHRVHSRL